MILSSFKSDETALTFPTLLMRKIDETSTKLEDYKSLINTLRNIYHVIAYECNNLPWFGHKCGIFIEYYVSHLYCIRFIRGV